MKSIINAAVLAAVIAVPAISFAQAQPGQQQPLTRAQVREEFVQLRAAGYDPADWVNYPENIQAAEARVAAKQAASAYGPATNGTSQTGD